MVWAARSSLMEAVTEGRFCSLASARRALKYSKPKKQHSPTTPTISTMARNRTMRRSPLAREGSLPVSWVDWGGCHAP